MSQSRIMSLVEAVANVTVGFGLALAAQMGLFRLVGIEASLRAQLGLCSAFTLMSIARSFLIRRLFTRLGR